MTTQNLGNPPRSTSTFFATTAIACFAYFVLALLLLHVLRPDRALTTSFISGYALGPYGWVMTTAWLAMSGGCLMLLLGDSQRAPFGCRSIRHIPVRNPYAQRTAHCDLPTEQEPLDLW